MTLVQLLVVLAVIAAVAAVAAGVVRGGLEEPTTSLPEATLPDGPVRSADLEQVRFSLGLRGYRMDEVDAVLDRLTRELADRDAELARLHAGRHERSVPPEPEAGPGAAAETTHRDG